ncbi:unnamed protein product [Closterium sp. Naga37s-1]|nr:unnamed protein product [Closterium sp. Naga37s-1]
MMSKTVNDFLYEGDHINMSPKRSDFVRRLVAHSGFTTGSDEAVRLVVHIKDKDIVKKTEKRFNNRIGKIYGGCRKSLRLIRGARLLLLRRAPNGTIRTVQPDDFATRCHTYVGVYGSSKWLKGIEWHLLGGHPFSSPAFMACARLFATEAAPGALLPLYASQLLLILAVGEFIGIGRICLAQWVTIPQEALDADVLGDEDAEDELDEDGVVDDESGDEDAS